MFKLPEPCEVWVASILSSAVEEGELVGDDISETDIDIADLRFTF